MAHSVHFDSMLATPQAANINGDTPLHMAAYHGQEWAVETLLRLGADGRATNDKGERPFEIAKLNDIRSMLKPSVSPGATAAGVAGAGGRVGRPTDKDSITSTGMHRAPVHQEYISIYRERGINTQNGGSHRRFSQESERPFSGAEPSGAGARREEGQQTSSRHHNHSSQSCTTMADGERCDRLVSSSLVSSLVSTGTLEGGSCSLHEHLGDDLSFEEGSSEGELSQENEGGMPRGY